MIFTILQRKVSVIQRAVQLVHAVCDITLFPLPVVIFTVESSACIDTASESYKPKDREVTSNSDIVEEEYQQEEDENI